MKWLKWNEETEDFTVLKKPENIEDAWEMTLEKWHTMEKRNSTLLAFDGDSCGLCQFILHKLKQSCDCCPLNLHEFGCVTMALREGISAQILLMLLTKEATKGDNYVPKIIEPDTVRTTNKSISNRNVA